MTHPTYRPIKIIARHTAEAGFKKIEKETGTKLLRPKSITITNEQATEIAKDFMLEIYESDRTVRKSIAGSLRRNANTVHDIDILISPHSETVRSHLSMLGHILWNGPDKLSILYSTTQIQVDFRFIEPDHWGPALQYFTGSREHNISLRSIAKSRGWHLSEKGLFDGVGKRLDDNTESSIYQNLDLRWLPPPYRNHAIGRKTMTDKERNEPKERCTVCDRPIRSSDIPRHIDECHKTWKV